MTAHDNGNGVLVVASGDNTQYATVNLSESASAESEDDSRVVVTAEDGTKGTFFVVGEGSVTVNEEGNVSASIMEESRLVFRAYPDGRSQADRTQEGLIANGTAAAEVHVMAEDGEAVAGAINYSSDTAVEVTESTEGTVRMTAERSVEQGTVVVTNVSETVLDATGDLSVRVDGDAAAEASSYSELRAATQDGPTSEYMVRQASSAEAGASATVYVAVNHFSTREVTMSESDQTTTTGSDGDTTTGETTADGATTEDTTVTDGDTTETTAADTTTESAGTDDATTTATSTDSGGVPGFTLAAALLALVGVAVLVRRD